MKTLTRIFAIMTLATSISAFAASDKAAKSIVPGAALWNKSEP